MASGNTLLLQRPDHTFENATSRSGAQHAGWNWSAVAADLDDDGWPDVYSTNGMWGDGRDHDVELEFWWQTLAYWDDYVAGTKTFDRKGAGIAGIERDLYFHNRGGAAAGDPLFEDRAFLDGLDLETNGRAAVAFDADGDGALDLFVRSVQAPEAFFRGSRKPEEHYLRIRLAGTPGVDNRDGIGARIAARLPGGRILAVGKRQLQRLSVDGKPGRSSGSGQRHPPGGAHDLVAVGPRPNAPRGRHHRPHDPDRRSARHRRGFRGAPEVNWSAYGSPPHPRSPRLRRRRRGWSRRRRLDRDPAEAREARPPHPGRGQDRPVRLESRRVDGRGLGLLPDPRPEAVPPPLRESTSQAGLPLLVLQRRRDLPPGGLRDRPHDARAHAVLPARPLQARRAPAQGRRRGRQRGLETGQGHRLHAGRGRRTQHAHDRKERRHDARQ